MRSSAERKAGSPVVGELREVVDGVYAYVQLDGTWWVNNAGVIAG
jgi:cyclase